jgi:hemoglobin
MVAGRSIFESIGGTSGCRRLAELLYTQIERDPLLRPFFPGKTHTCAIEEFAAFLVQVLGGPSGDTRRRWWLSLEESHRRFQIGAPERGAWLKKMSSAIDEMPVDESTREALRNYFQHASAYLVNHGAPPKRAGDIKCQELANSWRLQQAIDEAVAAIHRRDASRAISLVTALVVRDSMRVGLLAAMLQTRNRALIEYVHSEIGRNPRLVTETHNDGTLLNTAVAAGCVATVKFLLQSGADPNGGRHPSLYRLANQFGGPGGGELVRLLVEAGAPVDACDNVKRCTALHMAARRGHTEIAAALLDCGADIEARDSTRETPLRRAVNCSKPEVAALLVSRGADVHSVGSKGLTPLTAARSEAMRQALSGARKRRAL